MSLINAQTVKLVNAESGNAARDNRRMAKKPTLPASDFWKRLEQTLGDDPNWQPFNPNNVAMKLKMSQGSVHRWYTGVGLPELRTALELAKEGGVCVDWLLNAVKPRYPLSKDASLRHLFDLCDGLDEDGMKAVMRSAEGEQLRKQKTEETKKKAG